MASKEEDQKMFGLAGFEGIGSKLGTRLRDLPDSSLEKLTLGTEIGLPEVTPVYDELSPLREFGKIALPDEYVDSFRDKINVPEGEILHNLVPDVPASYFLERAKGKAALEASLAAGVGTNVRPVEIAGLLVHVAIDDDQEFLDAGAEALHDIGYVTIKDKKYALCCLQVNPSANLVEPLYLNKLGNALKGLKGDAPHRFNLDLCFEFSSEGSTRSINGEMVYLALNEADEDGDLPNNAEVAVVTNKAGYVGPEINKINPEFALNKLADRTFGYFKPKSNFLGGFTEFTKGTYDGSVLTLYKLATGKK